MIWYRVKVALKTLHSKASTFAKVALTLCKVLTTVIFPVPTLGERARPSFVPAELNVAKSYGTDEFLDRKNGKKLTKWKILRFFP